MGDRNGRVAFASAPPAPPRHPENVTTLYGEDALPYYVRAFLLGLHLAETPQFHNVIEESEKRIISTILNDLSTSALKLLSRLQRRRRCGYFRVLDLEKRYGEDFLAVRAAIQELELAGCLKTLSSVPLRSRSETSTSVDIPCLDPLWIFMTLTAEEIDKVSVQAGQLVQDVWKRCRAENKRPGWKRTFVVQIHTLCAETKTLSCTTLYNRVISALVEVAGETVTLPIALRTLFQKLEVLVSVATPPDDPVDEAGHFEFSLATPLLQACSVLKNNKGLPPTFFIESGSSQMLFGLQYGSQRCISKGTLSCEKPAVGSEPVHFFQDAKTLSQFQASRFAQKVVEDALQLKQKSEDVRELALVLQGKLLQYLEQRGSLLKRHDCQVALTDADKQFLDRTKHPFLFSFTPVSVLARVTWRVIDILESQVKHYTKAVELVRLLLASGLVPEYRAKLYNRLTVNLFCNLKAPQLALEASVEALEEICQIEETLPLGHWMEVAQRIVRILNVCCRGAPLQQSQPCFLSKPTQKKKSARRGYRKPTTVLSTKGCTTTSYEPLRTKANKSHLSCVSGGDVETASFQPVAQLGSLAYAILPSPLIARLENILLKREAMEKAIPQQVVEARPLGAPVGKNSVTSLKGKVSYLLEDDVVKTVEDMALDWYYNASTSLVEGGLDKQTSLCSWIGLHDEGTIIRSLFGVLMADEIFDTSIPSVFVTPLQTAPLDFFSEHFYAARKQRIESRLEALRQLSPGQLFFETLAQCHRVYPLAVVGVSWDLLKRVKAFPRGREWWETMRRLYATLRYPTVWSIARSWGITRRSSLFQKVMTNKGPNGFGLPMSLGNYMAQPSHAVVSRSGGLTARSWAQRKRLRGNTDITSFMRNKLAVTPSSTPKTTKGISETPPHQTTKTHSGSLKKESTIVGVNSVATIVSPKQQQWVTWPQARSGSLYSSTTAGPRTTSTLTTAKSIRTPLVETPLNSPQTSASRVEMDHEIFLFLAVLASGIGPHVLSQMLGILARSYHSMRSGFPDLILWRSSPSSLPSSAKRLTNVSGLQNTFSSILSYNELCQEPPSLEVMFSEVKSENDRLSVRQRQWISIVLTSGGKAEVFSVRAPSQKKDGEPTSPESAGEMETLSKAEVFA